MTEKRLWTSTDQIKDFVVQKLQTSYYSDEIALSELYQAYVSFCRENPRPVRSLRIFAVGLKRLIKFRKERRMVKGKQSIIYMGLILKETK
jgi:hypothetical protein